jgi:hypothetical protein
MSEKHLPDCSWHRDWSTCTCGLYERQQYDAQLALDQLKLAQSVTSELIRDCAPGLQLTLHNAFARCIQLATSQMGKSQKDSDPDLG